MRSICQKWLYFPFWIDGCLWQQIIGVAKYLAIADDANNCGEHGKGNKVYTEDAADYIWKFFHGDRHLKDK